MKKQKHVFASVLFFCLVGSTVLAQSQERYYYLPLRQLDIQGQWPNRDQASPGQFNWQNRQYLKYYMPYSVADNGEEIYIDFNIQRSGRFGRFDLWQIESVTQLLDSAHIAIKTARDLPLAGTLYFPKPDLSGMTAVKFTVSKETAAAEQETAKEKFYAAVNKHYDFLLNNGFTGAAWFRYRAAQARLMLEKGKPFDPNEIQPDRQFSGRDAFEESYSLFTGGRAVSENIQLDRTLQARLNEPRTIDISGIEGITTAQIDWKTLTKGVSVEKDPLARYIPADQHAIFYPTFKSMMTLMDELKSGRQSLASFGLDLQNLEQYEQQMCVWLDGWSRFWGPKTIRGVAFTGSDPYWNMGTDSAVLFDAVLAAQVYSNTESKQEEKLKEIKGAQKTTGTVEGVEYRAVISPDRQVCSYLAKIDNIVVVTNSLAQLKKIVLTAKTRQRSIADLDEYAFFRSRYSIDEDKQTAFLVLTDASIRRWCCPAWRIGAARRTMAAAILSQLQAEYLDNPAGFDLGKAQKTARDWAPDFGDISLTEASITSSTYGNLRFMTPIAELSIEKISEQERNQYRRFQESYQRQWRTFFDPIAISLLLKPTVLDVDMTIRPLIAASEYRQFMDIGGKNAIGPGDGDPHTQSLLQLILAVDADSEPLRQAGNFAQQMMMNPQINALGWLGRWITVYADEDPFWNELAEKLNTGQADSDFYDYMEKNINRLPLAVAMEAKSPAQLALFLVGLRAFIEQTTPGMTTWETLTYQEQSYVKVTARYQPDAQTHPSVYYAILPDALVLSFHEGLIKQAVDRGRLKAKPDTAEKQPAYQWMGRNLAAQVSEKAWPVIEMLSHDSYGRYLQMQSWNNLPILNEWHTRKGNLSELDFHRRYWNTIPSCPGGGQYVWNEQDRTFESSVFGHPGNPKMPGQIPTPLSKIKNVRLGVTFEEDGLRAKTVIERKE